MRDLNEGVKSMKVTVCFGRVRVVVPCADGSLTVGELQDKAISRFHKATGRPLSQWIRVRTLITSPDGAILDPNDRLKDVVDDRDQIIAIFEDHNGSLVQQCGDGTSGSSVSASSPEMFHDDHVNENDVVQNNTSRTNETGVIITSKDLITGSKLSVRRGSEPALNFKESETGVSRKVRHNGNRSQHSHSPDDLQELDSDSGVSGSDTADRKKNSQSLEAKDAQLRDFAYEKMIEAVNSDKSVCEVQDQKDSLKRPPTSSKLPDKEGGFVGRNGVAFRYSSIEDLDSSSFGEAGGTAPPIPPRKTPPLALQKTIASGRTNTRLLGKQIFLQLVKGPHGLGFTVTTRDNPAGGNCPIYVKNIKPQGAAIESGLLQPGDRLLQVNDIEVTGKSQSKVVSILRGIPEGSTVDLVISRQELLETRSPDLQQQQTIVCKEEFPSVPTPATGSELTSAAVEEGGSGAEDVDIFVFDIRLNSNSAVQGLGVKLKGKTASTPNEPKDLGLFIKSVIADGAVAKDGRLQPDDQLLEVNGERLLDQTNAEATRILRFALQKESNTSGFAKVIVARRKDGCSDTQVKNDHAAIAEKTEEQGRKGRTMSHKLQKQNGRLRVSDSRGLHNLSYQQAVDSAVQSGMSTSDCTVAKNSPPSMAFNGDRDYPDRTCASTKRSQVAHSAGNPESEKTGSTEQLNLDCKNLEITQETSSSDSETKSQAFQREGFGRQSMSEKRKGHLDPRTTEVYQKIRQNKGRFCSASLDRHRTNKSKPFEDLGTSAEETKPVVALKKTTSLESLKVAHQDPDPVTEPSKGPVDSQGRPCGTNNSFRAAVDRSYEKNRNAYEAQLNEAETSISSDKMSNLNDRSTGSKDLVESQGSKKDKGRGPFKVIGGILRFGRRKKDGLKADDSHSRRVDGGRDEVKGNGVKPSQQNEKRNPSDLEEQTWSDHLMVSRSLSEPKSILMNSSTKPDNPARMKKNGLVSSRSTGDQTDHPLPTNVPPPSRGPIRMDISPLLDLSNRHCPTTSQEKVSIESPSMNHRLMQLRQEHQRHHQQRQHRYPLDAQEEEYELRLRELEQQHALLLERENQGGSPSSVQYRSRVDMPPGSRNPYLERPMSCGSHYQNIDIVRSQLQLHDEYQLRYQAQLRYQQQIIHQQQQQQSQQQQSQQQQQHPVTIATQPPVHHRYSKSYSAQPLGVYPRSVSPAVFCNYQATQEVLQNCEAITTALPEYKHIPGPLQNQKAIPMVLQNQNRVSGPFQSCDDNRVGLQNFECNSQVLGNNGNFYENRSYKWHQVRNPSEHRFPSGGETDPKPVLSHRRYYSGFACHSRLPPGCEHTYRGNGPSALRSNDVEHYYSSAAHSGGQRQNQRDHCKY